MLRWAKNDANSYLPFSGLDEMKEAVTGLIHRRGGPEYDPYSEVVITQGDGDNMLDALLALTDPGDEVVLTDPTYAGMIQAEKASATKGAARERPAPEETTKKPKARKLIKIEETGASLPEAQS